MLLRAAVSLLVLCATSSSDLKCTQIYPLQAELLHPVYTIGFSGEEKFLYCVQRCLAFYVASSLMLSPSLREAAAERANAMRRVLLSNSKDNSAVILENTVNAANLYIDEIQELLENRGNALLNFKASYYQDEITCSHLFESFRNAEEKK